LAVIIMQQHRDIFMRIILSVSGRRIVELNMTYTLRCSYNPRRS